jgi:hypothetical protein
MAVPTASRFKTQPDVPTTAELELFNVRVEAITGSSPPRCCAARNRADTARAMVKMMNQY